MPLRGCSLFPECQHPFFRSSQPSCILPLPLPERVRLLHLWLWWPGPSSRAENLPCSAPHPPTLHKHHPQQMACTSRSVWLLLPEERLIGYSFFSLGLYFFLPWLLIHAFIHSFNRPTIHSARRPQLSVRAAVFTLHPAGSNLLVFARHTQALHVLGPSVPGRVWSWACNAIFYSLCKSRGLAPGWRTTHQCIASSRAETTGGRVTVT